jgi:predicted RNA polymerase sigma factor
MPQAKAEPTDARHLAMATVNAAVIKMHEQAMRDRPKWFWHLLKRCEAKAERIAAQAAQGQYACDATFIEVYAKTLPTLFTQALERLDSPEAARPLPKSN